jgi:acyl-CoA reductase-like NAD-dependent aldehyde dehydrogenase
MSPFLFHSGQICIAPTRLLVERSLYDEFTSKLAAAASALTIGDPDEEGVVVGPIISRAQLERIEGYVQKGVEEGATLACGGKRPSHLTQGFYFEPTLFTNATNDMTISREEIFGPVVTAIPFDDEEEAIRIANDSPYGLYGYVWSGDPVRALRVARALRTGTVQINGSPPNPDAPFGGYKQSGHGRDGGRFGLDAYSELKYVGWAS